MIRLNDLNSFSPATNAWTALAPSGPIPVQRSSMGFAATPDGKLYLFGGESVSGGGREKCVTTVQKGGDTRVEIAREIIRACPILESLGEEMKR